MQDPESVLGAIAARNSRRVREIARGYGYGEEPPVTLNPWLLSSPVSAQAQQLTNVHGSTVQIHYWWENEQTPFL